MSAALPSQCPTDVALRIASLEACSLKPDRLLVQLWGCTNGSPIHTFFHLPNHASSAMLCMLTDFCKGMVAQTVGVWMGDPLVHPQSS